MDVLYCINGEKNIIRAILPILKTYLHDHKNSRKTLELIKTLLTISSEFRDLYDIYLEVTS